MGPRCGAVVRVRSVGLCARLLQPALTTTGVRRGLRDEVEAAVDGDDLAGDPVGCWVGEGDDPPRHVVRVAVATQWDVAHLVGLDRLDGLGGQAGLRQDLGLGGPGGDRVDADPMGASSTDQLRVSASKAALLAP